MSETINQYFRGANFGLIAKAFKLGGGFISVFLLTRIIGPGGYGTYVLANTFIGLTSLVSRVGLDKCITYRVPRIRASKNEGSAKKYFVKTYINSLPLALIVAFFIWIAAPYVATLFGNEELIFWLRRLAIILPFFNLKPIFSEWLIATERVPESKVFGSILPRSISLLSLVLVFFLLPNTPELVFVSIMFSKVIPIIIWTFKEKTYANFELATLPGTDWWYGLRMMGNSILDRFLWRIDIFFVSYFLGDVATGGYNILVKFAKLGKLVDNLTTPVFRPKIGKFLEKGKIQSLKREYDELRIISLTSCLLYGLGLLSLGPWILPIFGPYQEYIIPSVILLAGYSVVISYGNIGNILVMEGEASWLLLASSAGLAVNLVGNYLLIPRVGVSGAAIATSLSLITLNTITYVIVRKVLSLDLSSWIEQNIALLVFSFFSVSVAFTSLKVNLVSIPFLGFSVMFLMLLKRRVVVRNILRLTNIIKQEYNRVLGSE